MAFMPATPCLGRPPWAPFVAPQGPLHAGLHITKAHPLLADSCVNMQDSIAKCQSIILRYVHKLVDLQMDLAEAATRGAVPCVRTHVSACFTAVFQHDWYLQV